MLASIQHNTQPNWKLRVHRYDFSLVFQTYLRRSSVFGEPLCICTIVSARAWKSAVKAAADEGCRDSLMRLATPVVTPNRQSLDHSATDKTGLWISSEPGVRALGTAGAAVRPTMETGPVSGPASRVETRPRWTVTDTTGGVRSDAERRRQFSPCPPGQAGQLVSWREYHSTALPAHHRITTVTRPRQGS